MIFKKVSVHLFWFSDDKYDTWVSSLFVWSSKVVSILLFRVPEPNRIEKSAQLVRKSLILIFYEIRHEIRNEIWQKIKNEFFCFFFINFLSFFTKLFTLVILFVNSHQSFWGSLKQFMWLLKQLRALFLDKIDKNR